MTRIGSLLLFCFSLLLLSAFPSKAAFSLSGAKPPSFNAAPVFAPVAQAFPFNFTQQGNTIYLDWQVEPGYYLYKDKFDVVANADAKIGELVLPKGQRYHDEFFGDVDIYKQAITLSIPLLQSTSNGSLSVHFQGCAEAGFCYPPEVIVVPLSAVTSIASSDSTGTSAPATPQLTDYQAAEQATGQATGQATEQTITSTNLVSSLSDNWWQPLLFFGLGIGLAFTPCVLPMYPILTGIVLGGGKKTHAQTFRLSMLYVQGMALTYTLLGLVVASAGLQFQAAFQHPYVLLGLSAMFILLAASMFGLFTIQLPSSLQTKLSELSNQQQGGSNVGVFAMGAISGVICSPCTTAPLSGALLYVAQSGDLITGAVTLYALALGMGIPLIAAGMFGNKLLPKAGDWMNRIKVFFGFILLAAPLFLIERLLSESISIWLWTLWGLSVLAWLYHISCSLKPGKFASALAIFTILGLSVGASFTYNLHFSTNTKTAVPAVNFIRIHDVNSLERELTLAKQAGKPVMLDFYADWCVACKQFEKYTFHNPEVAATLQDFVLLQADVTANRPQDIKLLSSLGVLGLPTIDFWAANGDALPQARISGFVQASPFLRHLEQHQLHRATP